MTNNLAAAEVEPARRGKLIAVSTITSSGRQSPRVLINSDEQAVLEVSLSSKTPNNMCLEDAVVHQATGSCRRVGSATVQTTLASRSFIAPLTRKVLVVRTLKTPHLSGPH